MMLAVWKLATSILPGGDISPRLTTVMDYVHRTSIRNSRSRHSRWISALGHRPHASIIRAGHPRYPGRKKVSATHHQSLAENIRSAGCRKRKPKYRFNGINLLSKAPLHEGAIVHSRWRRHSESGSCSDIRGELKESQYRRGAALWLAVIESLKGHIKRGPKYRLPAYWSTRKRARSSLPSTKITPA